MARKNDKLVEQMLEDLIAIGEDTIKVVKYGKEWEFKVLASEEYLRALQASSVYKDEYTRLFKLELEVLKFALVTIDGIEWSFEHKQQLLNNLNPVIVNTLYQEFDKLRANKESQLAIIEDREEEKKEEKKKQIKENIDVIAN